jgi:MinD superfamily P-loop ATPase
MKEIVIISGKGGTGKTSISASFAYLGNSDIVVADCDVDAADMHLLLNPDFAKSEDFFSGFNAAINPQECDLCGNCFEVCRFEAIQISDGEYTVDSLNCEGCGYCERVCPSKAISMEEQNVGKWYISNTKAGNSMVHARLGIGAENSGKLVAKVKNEAKRLAEENNKKFVVVDGSPGIGCPVVSSLAGANFVVLVTEPTVSGLHDLKRVYELVKKFNIKAGCIINKSDLNLKVTIQILDYLKSEDIVHICNLPYDDTFTEAMTAGQTITEYNGSNLKTILEDSWNKIKQITKTEGKTK